jgi:hypothetical protein
VANVSYVDFQRKKNLSEKDIYNTCYDKWLDIKRACNPSKTIAYEAITFIAAIEFLFSKNPDEVIFNSKFLQSKCKQGARQRSRFLAQLADLYEITSHTSYNYKEKEYHFVYSAKRTKESLEILKNPKEFYRKSAIKLVETPDKNDLHTSQKCLVSPTNLSTIYIVNTSFSKGLQEHRNSVEAVVEDKPLSYAKGGLSSYKSSIIKTETNTRTRDHTQENQNATFASCSLTEPKQVAPKSENQNKPTESVTNCDGLQPSKEIPKMKQDDIALLADEQTRKMLLSQALWKALGEERAGQIHDGCIFRELEPDKIGIYTGDMLLSDIDKDKIPKAIKSVYGENVKITGLRLASKTKEEEQPSNDNAQVEITPKLRPEKQNWLKFKSLIITSNLTGMLNNPMLKVIETPGKVIIETVPFLIERITAPGHLDELERVILETGLTLELHGTNPHSEYKNFYKDPIVLTPEKVLKDQEFKENYKPMVLSEILEEAKRNKEEK